MTTTRLLVLLVACSSAPTNRERVLRSFHATIDADLAASGVAPSTLASCGDVRSTYAELLASTTPARDCLARAFAACTPARITGAYMGMDAGPFYWSAIVAKGDSGCELRLYRDDRNDQYGSRVIERRRCAQLDEHCTPVWSETHMLCRTIATDGGTSDVCSDLPPDVTFEQ